MNEFSGDWDDLALREDINKGINDFVSIKEWMIWWWVLMSNSRLDNKYTNRLIMSVRINMNRWC
jgi:hypothetical protein